MSDAPPLDGERELVALACRILAGEGLVEGVLGHVSMRVDAHNMLIRCRGPKEQGLAFSKASDVRVVDLDGQSFDLPPGYCAPNELPIHGELLRARPGPGAVVHAHPPAVLIGGLAGIEFRAVFGSYNIPAMRMGLAGIPVYRRSVLIRRRELALEMIDVMGDADVCVLIGHGITVWAPSVEQAVVSAINLNTLAAVNVEVARLGASPPEIPPEDIAELPDLGSGFNDMAAWRYYAAKQAAQPSQDPRRNT